MKLKVIIILICMCSILSGCGSSEANHIQPDSSIATQTSSQSSSIPEISSNSSESSSNTESNLYFEEKIVVSGKEFLLKYSFEPTSPDWVEPMSPEDTIFFNMTIDVVNKDDETIQTFSESNIVTQYFYTLPKGTEKWENYYHKDSFKITDVNFDGEPDITFPICAVGRNDYYGAYIWDAKTEKFIYSNYSDICNPEINVADKLIFGRTSSSGFIGDYQIWEFYDNEFHFTKNLESETYSSGERSISDHRLIDGTMQEVFSIILKNREDVETYIEYFRNCHDWDEYFDSDSFIDDFTNDLIENNSSLENSSRPTAENTDYKRISIITFENIEISMEIPNYWVINENNIYPVDVDNWSSSGLSYRFSVKDDMIYTDDYFISGTNLSSKDFSILQLGAPPQNEPEFKLYDGTQVYYSDSGGAGSTFCEYEFIVDGKLVKMDYRLLNNDEDGTYNSQHASDDFLIHMLSTLEFV